MRDLAIQTAWESVSANGPKADVNQKYFEDGFEPGAGTIRRSSLWGDNGEHLLAYAIFLPTAQCTGWAM